MTTKYHKCSNPSCDAITSKDFCRHHSVVYNTCSYENCNRRCRKQYCNRHDPAYMEREKARIANKRLLKKNQTIMNQIMTD